MKVPLNWWAPCGKVIEAADGALVMPIYGSESEETLKATIHSCGLLRSRNGGKTWGEYSTIALGGEPMIGAAPGRRFSFEGPSVVQLSDGRWLAMVTARRLNYAGDGPSRSNEGPGAPLVLCRLWSKDEGRTWTRPDQLMPGAWPALVVADHHTLCVNTLWSAWGEMRLEVSRDGFESFFQELPMMTRGWIKHRANNPQEVPLPPTVPYLTVGWAYEHYGFSSVLQLDNERLIVIFGRTQRGTFGRYHFDPHEWNRIPMKKERITAVFYRRTPREKPLPPPMVIRKRPRGRWVLADRTICDDFACGAASAPNGDVVGLMRGKFHRSPDGGRTWQMIEGTTVPGFILGILRSGRWVSVSGHQNQEWVEGDYSTAYTHMGLVGGYLTIKHSSVSYDHHLVMHWSEDKGKTWHSTSGPVKGGLKMWAIPSVNHFIESPDGTVALPIFGYVTEEDMKSYSASNGVIRSHDGGKTWGDFSFVFRTRPKGPGDYQPEPRYTEMDIVQLPNGHWVAFSRTERTSGGPKGGGTTLSSLSTDFGRTWTETGGSLQGVSQQKGLVLPDGAIAMTYRCHSWQAPGVAIIYDEGRTFAYLLTGPYETCNARITGENEFRIFTGRSHRSDRSGGVYRWIAD